MKELSGLGGMLDRSAWERLLRAGRPGAYKPKDVLMVQGDPADFVLLLQAGKVKVERIEPGGSLLLLATRGAGEVLGELSVFGGGARTATVTALTECAVVRVEAHRFRGLADELRFTETVIRHLLARMRESEERRAELAHLSARRRVANALLWLSLPGGEDDPGLLTLSQDELATAAGLTRSTTAAELSRLRCEGVIATGPRALRIKELVRLRRIADGAEPGR